MGEGYTEGMKGRLEGKAKSGFAKHWSASHAIAIFVVTCAEIFVSLQVPPL